MTPYRTERPVARRLLVLVCLSCCLAGAATALAASARLTALAGEDVIEDTGDPVRWFGATADHAGTLRFHWGDYRPEAPAPLRVTRQVAGCVAGLGPGGGRGAAGLFLYGDQPDRTLQSLLAWHAGASVLGLSVGWNDRDAAVAAPGGEAAWSVEDLEVGLGWRTDLGEQAYLDAAVAWTSARRRLHGGTAGADGRWEGVSAVRARLFLGLGESAVLVPVVAWEGSDRPSLVDDLDEVYRRDDSAWDLRLGLLLLPDPDTSWHVTAGWRGRREVLTDPLVRPADSPTGERELSAWLLRLGWERRVSAWCSLRAGATTALVDRDGTLPAAADPTRARFDLVLGAAFHAGEVDLDIALSDDPPALPRLGERGDPLAASRAWTSVTLTASF